MYHNLFVLWKADSGILDGRVLLRMYFFVHGLKVIGTGKS